MARICIHYWWEYKMASICQLFEMVNIHSPVTQQFHFSGQTEHIHRRTCVITADSDCGHEILSPWKENYDKLRQRIKKQRPLC